MICGCNYIQYAYYEHNMTNHNMKRARTPAASCSCVFLLYVIA